MIDYLIPPPPADFDESPMRYESPVPTPPADDDDELASVGPVDLG